MEAIKSVVIVTLSLTAVSIPFVVGSVYLILSKVKERMGNRDATPSS